MTSRTTIPVPPTTHESLRTRGADLVSTGPNERAELLDGTKWAVRHSWSDIKGLARYLRHYRIAAGRAVFREGDHDAFLAIVVSGELEIHKADHAEHARVVARVGAGKMVGEMSLIDGAARSATAIAAVSTELLVLSRDDFQRLGQQSPTLALSLMVTIATAIAQLLRQTTGTLVDLLDR